MREAVQDHRAFILRHTRLQAPPHAPELRLHLADEVEPIWRMTETELGALGLPPPFWAFAWAGGQALARYLLDHPDEVRGRRVLDFATGGGIAAIAAARAGAATVLASDIDPFALAAATLNAEVNGVRIELVGDDLLQHEPPGADVMMAGDVCYERPMSDRVMSWLERGRQRGARVLIGDPGRSYFPSTGLIRLADYAVPTTRELEDREVKRTGVWTLA